MTKEIWLSLPVKDIARCRAFYAAIGFTEHARHKDSNEMTGFAIGEKKMMVMFVAEATFVGFARHAVADTSKGSEVLISFDAETREEVDAWMKKAEAAGGTIYTPPGGEGWLYGGGFADPDGHRWNVLYMDMSQMPKV